MALKLLHEVTTLTVVVGIESCISCRAYMRPMLGHLEVLQAKKQGCKLEAKDGVHDRLGLWRIHSKEHIPRVAATTRNVCDVCWNDWCRLKDSFRASILQR